MAKIRIIDPSPAGWRYGFPKACPEYVTDLGKWAVDNGYPQELLYIAVFRQWYHDEELDIT